MNTISQFRFHQSIRRTQRGLSLVELMVALTIGLFLLGAVGIIYVNTATTSRSSTLESQMNEDAALALELLQQQIRLTGFSNVNASGSRLFPGQAIRGCDGGFTDNAAGTAFATLACNTAGTGPDALAVRYEASLLNSQSVTGAGVERPGNCAHEGIANWEPPETEGVPITTPLTSLPLADNRYYIADDNGTPSLWCQGRTGTGFGTATALIPNIEDMQVQYAVTALPAVGDPIPHQIAGYVDADHEVLTRTSVSPQPNSWSRVAALRVCLLARSARPVPTGDNALADIGRYIDCNGDEQTATDRFLRRAYVTTIQLRNMRPGLPSDYELGGDPWQYMYDN